MPRQDPPYFLIDFPGGLLTVILRNAANPMRKPGTIAVRVAEIDPAEFAHAEIHDHAAADFVARFPGRSGLPLEISLNVHFPGHGATQDTWIRLSVRFASSGPVLLGRCIV